MVNDMCFIILLCLFCLAPHAVVLRGSREVWILLGIKPESPACRALVYPFVNYFQLPNVFVLNNNFALSYGMGMLIYPIRW